MIRKIWQWLKQWWRGLFAGEKADGTTEQSYQPQTLTDTDYEFMLNQLLEGVVHGWQQKRIEEFFAQLQGRSSTQEWITWLKSFGGKVLSSQVKNQELGRRMMLLGEKTQSSSVQEIGIIASEIGQQLLLRETSGVVWEYDGPDALPGQKEPPTKVETFTVDELSEKLAADANLRQTLAQQLGLQTDDPEIIIQALVEQLRQQQGSAE
ncbi:MAG: hypothetical protein WA865_15685 [Spirulinaceae cyanobacterium]